MVVKKQLDAKKGSNFEVLAKKYSIDHLAQNGGDLGWFRKGQLVSVFDEAVFALKVGQVSDVIKTEFGYHLVKLEEINFRPALKLEQVKSQIEQILRIEKKQILTQAYISELKKGIKITRDLSKISSQVKK